MARIRPLTKIEDIEKAPADQDIVIDIASLEDKPVVVNTATETINESDAVVSDNNAGLLKQLADLQASEEDYRIQTQNAQRERDEALARERQQAQQVQQIKSQAEQAQLDSILNALGAAQSEADAAQSELEQAIQASDAKAQAEAYRKLSRAENRISQLEIGRDNFEAKREEHKVQPQLRQPTPNEVIDSLQGLMDSERQWLKSHPDSMMDQRKYQRLQIAYEDSQSAGLSRGSPEYFVFLEQRLGYKKQDIRIEDANEKDEPEERPVTQKRNTKVSAPVSRQTLNMNTGQTQSSSGPITLSPQEREVAMAIKESHNRFSTDKWTDAQALVEYAKQKVKFQHMKNEGYYSQN